MSTVKGRLARYARATLISFVGAALTLAASAGPQDDAGFLWTATTYGGLINVDTDTGTIRFEKDVDAGFYALGVNDVNGDVWAYQEWPNSGLVSYNRFGQPLTSTFDPLYFWWSEPPTVTVDGIAGNVWLSIDSTLYRFDMSGALQQTISVPSAVIAAALVRNQSKLWVATSTNLLAYDEDGVLLQTIVVGNLLDPATWINDLAYDRYLNELWVSRTDRLQRRDVTGAVTFTLMGDFSGPISPDGSGGLWHSQQDVSGGLWDGFVTRLRHISPSGTVDANFEPFGDTDWNKIEDFAGDPVDASVWVASNDMLRQFAVTGAQLEEIDGEFRKLERAAIYTDLDAPELSFTTPANGSTHVTQTPAFALSFFDLGVGIDTATLAFKVDGTPRSFNCTFTASAADCTPATALANGARTVTATIKDRVGNVSATVQRAVVIDTVPPVITVAQPTDGSYTNQVSATITGSISEPATLTINGSSVSVNGSNAFTYGTTLNEGANSFTLVATDLQGHVGNANLTVYLDTLVPSAPADNLIDASVTAPGQITVSGAAGSVEGGSTVRIRNTRTGEVVTVVAAADGSFTANLAGALEDELEISQVDRATNTSAPTLRSVVPPNPVNVAPPLSEEEFTPMQESVSFLYEGANPVQVGVVPGTVDPYRVAVLRGRVKDRAGAPLGGVRITVKDQPDLGHTLTRHDGTFDLVVNGGGAVLINYSLDGYLPAQRQLDAAWRDYTSVEDVVLVQLDSALTTVAMGAGAPQLASGTETTDAAGTRQATALFPSGLTATMTLPDGSTAPLSTLDFRATEYTVGENGQQAMPAQLPATSGYTYAVELSVDQALAAGASGVQFSAPVPIYVDNFMEFPVGQDVPSGYYDMKKGMWVASLDGRVMKVLSEGAQGAVLDVTGSGTAATATQLTALGITAEERIAIAQKYEPGKIFWRVPVTHFSIWDFNFQWGVPTDGTPPPTDRPETPEDPDSCDNAPAVSGCVIDVATRELGEDLSLVGVPYGLHYRSSRTPGGRRQAQIAIPLSGATVPASLEKIKVKVSVAGRTFDLSFAPAPNLKHTFSWDGKDAYGRPLTGTYQADVIVSYQYKAQYYASAANSAKSFLQLGGAVAIGTKKATREISLSRRWKVPMTGARSHVQDVGGWTLDAHHYYDPASQTLYRGDGSKISAAGIGLVVKTVSGGGTTFAWDIPATNSSVQATDGTAVSASGEVFFGGNGGPAGGGRIYKIDRGGILRFVTNTSFPIADMEFGADGLLYVATGNASGVQKIDVVTKAITQLASGGQYTNIDVTPNGSVYVWDEWCDNNANATERLRHIEADGTNSVALQVGSYWCNAARALAVGVDGSVYYLNGHLMRLTPQGQNVTFMTTDSSKGKSFGDGGHYSNASLYAPSEVWIDRDGTIYIREGSGGGIRAIGADGTINTVATGGTVNYPASEGGPARAASSGHNVTVGPDGSLYDIQSGRVRKFSSALLDFAPSAALVASTDGREVYSFTDTGRHVKTQDAFTGATLYTFGYNAKGELTTVTDVDGDVTTIVRDAAGKPLAVVGPDGHSTGVSTDRNGYLSTLSSPAGHTHTMSYSDDGLLLTFEDPRLQDSTYTYDPATGGLATDQNAMGGGWTLVGSKDGDATITTATTAEGRKSIYRVETLRSGDFQSIVTAPDNTVTTRVSRADSVGVSTAADGTVTEVKELADPRFGSQAPVTTTTLKTHSGLTGVTTVTRTATLSNKFNPLSLTAWSETSSLNGKNSVTTYAPTTKTWTAKSPLNRQSVTTLDAEGRPATSKFANFETTTYAYLPNGRLDTVSSGSGLAARLTDFAYYGSGPYAGLLQSVTDAENRTVSYEYDLAGRMTKQTLPDNRFISFGYDANGNLTSITPPDRDAHVFSYNAGDLEERYTPPDAANVGTRFTQYVYNLDKDLDLITRPDGQQVDFVYNGGPGTAKKLSSIVIPTGSYDYTYKPATGQLDTLTAPGGQGLAYTYDGFLLKSETASGTIAGTVEWGYNTDFRVSSQSINGSALTFGYDNDGLLTTAGALTLTRNATHGLITSTTLATNATTSHTYNTFGEPATDEAKYGTTVLYSASYPVRDKLGRIKQKVEAVQGTSHTYDYTYDTAGRLDTVTKDGILVSDYDYDTNSNRTTVNGGTVASYDGQDRLTSYDGTSYTYTANGELLTKVDGAGTTTYGYDVLGNLRTVALPGGTSLEYVIDGRNRRVGKKVNGALVQGLLYVSQLAPAAEVDGSGNLVSRFIYGAKGHVPDYMIKAGVTYRIVSDYLGSVRLVINTIDGSIAQRIDYDEFGVITSDTNPGFQPFGFAGGLYDQHTKLTRFGARDYDARIGRWTAKDPVDFAGADTNLQSYAYQDPINFLDSEGLTAAVLPRPVFVPEPVIRPMPMSPVDPVLPIPDSSTMPDGANAPPGDPCKGLREQLKKHEEKLKEYKENPKAHDNLGFLGKGYDQYIIPGRIRNLERQIDNFRKQLQDCERKNGIF